MRKFVPILLAIGVAGIAHAQLDRVPRDRAAPSRPDIEATFSSGTVRIEVAGHVFEPRIRSGLLSLSTNDVRCTPTADEPCAYTVNLLRLTAEPFEIDGQVLSDVTISNSRVVTRQLDFGGGFPLRPHIPFWVRGFDGSTEFAIHAESRSPDDIVELANLVFSPTALRATIFARLSGTIGTDFVRVTVMTTADLPLRNLAPLADAGPDRAVATSCTADLTLDASGTTDTDGNLSRTFYTVADRSIGSASAPIRFPIGEHDVELVAEDSVGGRSRDHVRVIITDDGGAAPIPGSALVSIEIPRGTAIESFALVGQRGVTLANRSEVVGASGDVASMEALEVGTSASVGEAWAAGPSSLLRDATIRGALHTDADVTIGPGARILGGIVPGPLVPPERVTFHVVLPIEPGGDVLAGPGQMVRVPEGDHGTLRAMPRSTIVLEPGIHVARDLDLIATSELLAEPGPLPTVLAVTGTVRQIGMVGSTGADPALLIVYLGTERLRALASLEGWVVAPNATLEIETPSVHRAGSLPEHRGAFFAQRIELAATTRVVHVPLDLGFVRESRGACTLEPVVDCVRAKSGHFVAVFGYRSILDRFGAVVPLGVFNRVVADGLPFERAPDQPLAFFPREQRAVFEVPFTERASWTLGGRRAIATEGSVRCP